MLIENIPIKFERVNLHDDCVAHEELAAAFEEVPLPYSFSGGVDELKAACRGHQVADIVTDVEVLRVADYCLLYFLW